MDKSFFLRLSETDSLSRGTAVPLRPGIAKRQVPLAIPSQPPGLFSRIAADSGRPARRKTKSFDERLRAARPHHTRRTAHVAASGNYFDKIGPCPMDKSFFACLDLFVEIHFNIDFHPPAFFLLVGNAGKEKLACIHQP